MPDVRSYLRENGVCAFADRFARLGDPRAMARIDSAVRKIGRGLRPDVRPAGESVQEARIDYGPGYRVYFGIDGTELVVLLLCGDKRTQGEDMVFAKTLRWEYRTRKAAARKSAQSGMDVLLKPEEDENAADP